MSHARVSRAARDVGLMVMGALHPTRGGAGGLEDGTLILLGTGAGFWLAFSGSPEARDGCRDPIDRWSERVVADLATQHGARAIFPFGGPPHAPFIDWALKSARAFSSPTGMLVHDTVGLMISYRGALHFSKTLEIPPEDGTSPCPNCAGQPCVSACPVAALGGDAPYDVALCHEFLDRPAGERCMIHGCAARLACPASQGSGRCAEQSALHMKAFHPT